MITRTVSAMLGYELNNLYDFSIQIDADDQLSFALSSEKSGIAMLVPILESDLNAIIAVAQEIKKLNPGY